jgi:hypothetical protein
MDEVNTPGSDPARQIGSAVGRAVLKTRLSGWLIS